MSRSTAPIRREFLPIMAAGIILVAAHLTARRNQARGDRPLVNWGDLRLPEGPLFARPVHYFGWASLCALLAFVLILGPHPENYMNYPYQLLTPMLLLWLAEALRGRRALGPAVTGLFLLNLTVFSLARLAPADLQQPTKSREAWTALYRQLDACKVPLNSPTTAAYLMQHNKWPIDSGHTEYFFGAQPTRDRWFGLAWGDRRDRHGVPARLACSRRARRLRLHHAGPAFRLAAEPAS
jgi:hypothetical protein